MIRIMAEMAGRLDRAGQYDLADRVDSMIRESGLFTGVGRGLDWGLGKGLKGLGKGIGFAAKHPVGTLGTGATALTGANYLRDEEGGFGKALRETGGQIWGGAKGAWKGMFGQGEEQRGSPGTLPPMEPPTPQTPSVRPGAMNSNPPGGPQEGFQTMQNQPMILPNEPLSDMHARTMVQPGVGPEITYGDAIDMVRGGVRGGTPRLDEVNEARAMAGMPPVGQAAYQTMYPAGVMR